MVLDGYDRQILDALQRDGSLTNGRLSELTHLSASQCSRRRAALEEAGLVIGYHARLHAAKLGLNVRAIVRVNLRMHDREAHLKFSQWVGRQPEVLSAFSVSGDADYILDVCVSDLDTYSDFLHDKLLIQHNVGQVRSEFVLKTLKDGQVLDLSGVTA